MSPSSHEEEARCRTAEELLGEMLGSPLAAQHAAACLPIPGLSRPAPPLRLAMFKNLGPTLIRLRERAGKSQAAVARAAGVGKSQLSKYETSKELPKLESLERVLVALGVSYFEFFWMLDVIDRGEQAGPTPRREEIDERFTRLTQGIFALHREVVKGLCHE